VRVTPLESAVGMQQNTASPKASSGRPSGSRCTANASSGVRNRMDTTPYAAAPQLLSALAASPRLRLSPCTVSYA